MLHLCPSLVLVVSVGFLISCSPTKTDYQHALNFDDDFMQYLQEIESENDIQNWNGKPYEYYKSKRGFYR